MNRSVLLQAHSGRPEAIAATSEMIQALRAFNITPILADDPHPPRIIEMLDAEDRDVEVVADGVLPDGVELVVVLGGDGTILRAAELVHGTQIPVLGVNLGHVGFLAEAEREDIEETAARIAAKDYLVEERMTLDVVVSDSSGVELYRSFALNEAALEKSNRGKMIDVMIEVDGRGLSSFGCDGVVLATATGSTAHAFSAGGPVAWPDVEAIFLVPLSAHALFARPLVVGKRSTIAVQLAATSSASGVMWCDGRRMSEIPSGSRVEVRRGTRPVRLARISTAPFTDRLVRKFALPVQGWRDRGKA